MTESDRLDRARALLHELADSQTTTGSSITSAGDPGARALLDALRLLIDEVDELRGNTPAGGGSVPVFDDNDLPGP